MGIGSGTAEYEAAFEQFKATSPEWESTKILDDLRATEYRRLDEAGHIYLDYTGGGLYGESQVRRHLRMLESGIYGNPHSSNPSSMASSRLLESTREAVLRFFNASPEEYAVIFTQNASAALKLVGEAFPFESGSHYLLTFDNHNSVNGIREFARKHGAEITYIPVILPEMRVDDDTIDAMLDLATGGNNLFAYPAQSNFSGAQHPLEWIARAQAKGWTVLLDGAAFVPTNRLDLSVWHPDFVPVSFYKMFGYPTGIGCLLARRPALSTLRRPWFAGGTITVASVQGDAFYLAPGEAAFEEGTLNYLGIPAVEIGLETIRAIGLDLIHRRVHALGSWLLENLMALKYDNGCPLATVYGPHTRYRRGGTIALNFQDSLGRAIDHRLVEQRANAANISLRTGCFCNPGAGEVALELTRPELLACFAHSTSRMTFDEFRVCIDGKSSGAVRVSVGLATNFADVYRFIDFAKGLMAQQGALPGALFVKLRPARPSGTPLPELR